MRVDGLGGRAEPFATRLAAAPLVPLAVAYGAGARLVRALHRRHLLAAAQHGPKLIAALKDFEHSQERVLRRVRNVGGQPANLLKAEEVRARLNLFELSDA